MKKEIVELSLLKKVISFCFIFLISSSIVLSADHTVNWNEENITWLSYQEGINQSKESGKPVLMILYAEWCSICHAYKNIFSNADVFKKIDQVIPVRVNAESLPKISSQYDLDGEYVPRVFLLNSGGQPIENLNRSRAQFKFFISADNPDEFVRLIDLAVEKAG